MSARRNGRRCRQAPMTGSCAAGPAAAGWSPPPPGWPWSPCWGRPCWSPASSPRMQETVAPAGGVVRVPQQGFELPVPAGWKVQRQLTGPGSQVVGVVLVPRSGQPPGAAITVAADDDQPIPKYAGYILELQVDASQRADGRLVQAARRPRRPPRLREGSGRPLRHRLACLAPLLPAAAHACRAAASLRARPPCGCCW